MKKKDIALIKVGNNVKIILRGSVEIEGYIGELYKYGFYLWTNNPCFNGGRGSLNPMSKGFRYSWRLTTGEIEFITVNKKKKIRKNTRCQDITEFMSKLEYLETR